MLISPISPTAGHHSTLLRIQLEADPIAAPGAIEMQRVQPYPSYRGISAVRSGIWLCCIIIANCFCSALICVCLGGFSKIENLTRWEKRSFNTLSLLLSAALGFGICFLFNQAGLMARGTILQGGPYSKKEVCASLTVVNA